MWFPAVLGVSRWLSVAVAVATATDPAPRTRLEARLGDLIEKYSRDCTLTRWRRDGHRPCTPDAAGPPPNRTAACLGASTFINVGGPDFPAPIAEVSGSLV